MQRPKLLVILTGKIEPITQMDYWVKVTPKRSYSGPMILTPFSSYSNSTRFKLGVKVTQQ